MKNIGFRAHDLGLFSSATDLGRCAASYKKPVVLHLAVKKAIKGARDPLAYDDAYVRSIHDDLAKEGVSIAVIGSYFNPIHPDEAIRNEQIARFVASLRYASAFGTRLVATETGSANPDCSYNPETSEMENLSLFYRTVETILEAAEKYDAVACLEAVSRQHTICTIDRMAKVMEKFPSPHLGVLYDPVNLVPYTGIPEEDGSVRLRPSDEAQKRYFSDAFDAFGDRIKLIHVKDYRLDAQGLKVGNLAAGTGVVNWKLFSSLLDERHIDVPCTLENLNVVTLKETVKALQ